MSNHDFPRIYRLLNSRAFTAVFTNTKLKIQTPSFLVLVAESTATYPRLGCIVAKKHVRRASQRNQIKRLIRETFRLNRNHLLKYDFVVMVKNSVVKTNQRDIYNELHLMWQKTPLMQKEMVCGK